MHCQVSPLSYTRATKTINALNVVLTHSFISLLLLKESQTGTISASESFCSQFLRVAVSIGTMQLTLSMAIMQVTTSVAFMEVVRWYFLLLV